VIKKLSLGIVSLFIAPVCTTFTPSCYPLHPHTTYHNNKVKIWLKHRLWELLPNLTGLHFIFSSDVYADTSTDAASFGTLPKYLTRLNIALHTFGTARVDLQKLVASLTSTYPALQDIIVSEHRTRYWSKSTAGSYVHWDSKRGVIKKKTRW